MTNQPSVIPLAKCGNTPEISVVAPVFNEAEGVAAFVSAVSDVLNKITDSWELVLVDDGSCDDTWEVLERLHRTEYRVKMIRFSRNFGVQTATSAGLRFARGKAVITMDSDLQHPPELIPQMIQRWRTGIHYVYTVRQYDEQTGLLKRLASATFRKMMNSLSELSMPEGLCDYRLLDRKVVDTINAMDESSRFLRGMISFLGFKQCGIPFRTNPRFAGVTKYSFAKLLRLSIDSITSFSVKPLRWITYCGLAVALFSIFYGLFMIGEAMMRGITTPGFPTLITAISFLGGMQLIALGIIGEYVGRIYLETKRRPLFIIQEQCGFEMEANLETQRRAA